MDMPDILKEAAFTHVRQEVEVSIVAIPYHLTDGLFFGEKSLGSWSHVKFGIGETPNRIEQRFAS